MLKTLLAKELPVHEVYHIVKVLFMLFTTILFLP